MVTNRAVQSQSGVKMVKMNTAVIVQSVISLRVINSVVRNHFQRNQDHQDVMMVSDLIAKTAHNVTMQSDHKRKNLSVKSLLIKSHSTSLRTDQEATDLGVTSLEVTAQEMTDLGVIMPRGDRSRDDRSWGDKPKQGKPHHSKSKNGKPNQGKPQQGKPASRGRKFASTAEQGLKRKRRTG